MKVSSPIPEDILQQEMSAIRNKLLQCHFMLLIMKV